jgi:hypothetical protein
MFLTALSSFFSLISVNPSHLPAAAPSRPFFSAACRPPIPTSRFLAFNGSSFLFLIVSAAALSRVSFLTLSRPSVVAPSRFLTCPTCPCLHHCHLRFCHLGFDIFSLLASFGASAYLGSILASCFCPQTTLSVIVLTITTIAHDLSPPPCLPALAPPLCLIRRCCFLYHMRQLNPSPASGVGLGAMK